MNEKPHAHRLDVDDRGSYWGISYGDQPRELPDKPWRFTHFWESDEAYARRSQRALMRHVRRIVGNHDRASRRAGLSAFALPAFRVDEWASEQLKAPRT